MGSSTIVGSAIANGQWEHVALSYDSTSDSGLINSAITFTVDSMFLSLDSEMSVYLNGVRDNTATGVTVYSVS